MTRPFRLQSGLCHLRGKVTLSHRISVTTRRAGFRSELSLAYASQYLPKHMFVDTESEGDPLTQMVRWGVHTYQSVGARTSARRPGMRGPLTRPKVEWDPGICAPSTSNSCGRTAVVIVVGHLTPAGRHAHRLHTTDWARGSASPGQPGYEAPYRAPHK